MSLTITITQTGFTKAKPTLADLKKLLGAHVHVGGIGPFSVFQQQPGAPMPGTEAEYMLYGRSGTVGRGFYLIIKQGWATLDVTTPLPTTGQDLENMFTAAAALASHLKVRGVLVDGQQVPVSAMHLLYPEAVATNRKILKSYAASQPGLTVGAVKMPLTLPETLFRRMASVPEDACAVYFADYLNDKQNFDYYYMKPTFRKDGATGEVYVTYALTEGVDSVVQKEPFVPYGPSPAGDEPISRWMVGLVSQHLGPVGFVPYDVFAGYIENLPKRDFDERHWFIHGLSEKKMQDLRQLGFARL